MDPLPIVVALDVREEIAPRFVPGRPTALVHELDLGVWKKLSIGALSRQLPRRLMEALTPAASRSPRYSPDAYWQRGPCAG